MSLVCGIDFSPASASAADVAARLARRLRTDLVLLHVLDAHALAGGVAETTRNAAAAALEHEVERVRQQRADVSGQLLEGKPDRELARLARELDAHGVLIGARDSRSAGPARVGGSADRITQSCEAPVIVVRDPEPFLLWLDGVRPLKVLVAVDRTNVSREALRFVRTLRTAGPVDVSLLRVYWVPEERRRLGYLGGRSWMEADPKLEQVLVHELEEEVGEIEGEGEVQAEVALTLGRVSDRIVEQAAKEEVDLVVVGSHRRNLLERLWSGSTSRHVLHDAATSVAVVTAGEHRESREIPRIDSVLVATDFSETGDAAVRWAYGLIPAGGVVHLIHVEAPPSGTSAPRDIFDGPPANAAEEAASLRHMLLERVPPSAGRRRITTDAFVIWSAPVPTALLQAAERLGVDAVVLGTRGKSRIGMAVLGSVAQEVAAQSPRPVLLVHGAPK